VEDQPELRYVEIILSLDFLFDSDLLMKWVLTITGKDNLE
jgi:hypothetical protein